MAFKSFVLHILLLIDIQDLTIPSRFIGNKQTRNVANYCLLIIGDILWDIYQLIEES